MLSSEHRQPQELHGCFPCNHNSRAARSIQGIGIHFSCPMEFIYLFPGFFFFPKQSGNVRSRDFPSRREQWSKLRKSITERCNNLEVLFQRKVKHPILRDVQLCCCVSAYLILHQYHLNYLHLKSGALNEHNKGCPLYICLNGQNRKKCHQKRYHDHIHIEDEELRCSTCYVEKRPSMASNYMRNSSKETLHV